MEQQAIIACPLFRGLDHDELALLGFLLKPQNFKAGDLVFPEGSQGKELYVVAKGRVSIDMRISPEQPTANLALMRRGDAFGELALIDGRARSASATAMDDVLLLVMKREDFLSLLESHPRISARILHNFAVVLADRLRDNNMALRNHLMQGGQYFGVYP